MLRRYILILLAAFVGGCTSARSGGDAADLRLQVRPVPAAAGDSLTVVLVNASAGSVGYNLCPTALERREGDTWRAVPSDRICTLELRTLEPGQEDSFTFLLPADLPAGDYRAVTNVERLETGETSGLTSEPFGIE